MWIARDKDGSLNFFTKEPYRYILGQYTSHEKHVWLCDDYNVCHTPLPENMFPKLTWEDEPIEVDFSSIAYHRLVESKRRFDHVKIWDYCKNECPYFHDCIHEGGGPCDDVLNMFEIK